MSELLCPGCGEKVSLNDLQVGEKIDCSNCANLTLRLKEKDGKYFLEEIPKASCPNCNQIIEVRDNLVSGDTLTCCGEEFTLTYEFGAYALDKTQGRPSKA